MVFSWVTYSKCNSIIFLVLVAVFSANPELYQRFQSMLNFINNNPKPINETIIPFLEYLPFYAVQVASSFILAFPIGIVAFTID